MTQFSTQLKRESAKTQPQNHLHENTSSVYPGKTSITGDFKIIMAIQYATRQALHSQSGKCIIPFSGPQSENCRLKCVRVVLCSSLGQRLPLALS